MVKMIAILLFVASLIVPMQCNNNQFFQKDETCDETCEALASDPSETSSSSTQTRSKVADLAFQFGISVPLNRTGGSVLNEEGQNIYSEECLSCTGQECWETKIGQEMYRMILVDGIKSVIMFLTVGRVRSLLTTSFDQKKAENIEGVKGKVIRFLPNIRQEFELMQNLMEVISMQCFTWIGMFYCPWLPIIFCVRLAIADFTCKKIELFEYCKPPARYRFKGSDFFYWILLLFFAEGFGIVALMLVYATPSYYCGPLALHWDLLDPEERTMMDVLGKYLNHSEAGDGTVWSFHNVVTIIYNFGKARLALWVVIVILVVNVYRMYKLNDQNEKTIQTFYEQKKHETEIKKYVIEELNNAKKKVSEYRGELKVFKGKDKEKRKNR